MRLDSDNAEPNLLSEQESPYTETLRRSAIGQKSLLEDLFSKEFYEFIRYEHIQMVLFFIASFVFAVNSQAQDTPPLRTDTDMALRDFEQRKTLAGLPDLKKPVYIKPKILVCESASSLANPNVSGLLLTRVCAYSEKNIKVNVLVPQDAQTYMQNYLYSMIEVSWQTGEHSSRRTAYGWLYLNGLTN